MTEQEIRDINIAQEINSDRFKLPDMGEYYDEDMMEDFLVGLDKANPKQALYYIEEPVSTRLGYHPEFDCFIIKAKPKLGKEVINMSELDGDTVSYEVETIEDGNNPFEIDDVKYKSVKDYMFDKMNYDDFKEGIFKIRSIGVDAPEIPHYAYIPVKKKDLKDSDMYKLFTAEEIKNYGGNIKYLKLLKREADKKYPFIKKENDDSATWYEVVGENKDDEYNDDIDNILKNLANGNKDITWLKIVSKDDQTQADIDESVKEKIYNKRHTDNTGIYAQEIMETLLSNADDMRIVIDAKQLGVKGGLTGPLAILGKGVKTDKDIWNVVKAFAQSCFGEDIYMYKGFNTFGQDAYRRFLGALYVKTSINGTESSWINVSKFIMSQLNGHMKIKMGQTPFDQANGNGVSDAFKIWSYDNTNCKIVDAFLDFTEHSRDDRREIQRQVTGLDYSKYKDFTVMIGDCLFMVPPTSIRVVNQVQSERVNLLRSKASMTRTIPHVDRVLEMTLYFNSNEGVNGIPITRDLPNKSGTKTYYMNGLRSLISHFKLTPFLPIENEYINEDLGIEAVSLAKMQIQTMPMYPKCMAVTLTLQQFNYRIYMKDMPVPDPDKGEKYNKNMFATSIDFETMRYYYQKGLERGANLLGMDYLNQEYIEKTMGSRTNLIPMEFKDQSIKFAILDKNWLDKKQEVYNLSQRQPVMQNEKITKEVADWANNFGETARVILETVNENSGTIKTYNIDETIGYWRTRLIEYKKCPYLLDVKLENVGDALSTSSFVTFSIDTSGLTTHELENLMKSISKEISNYDAKTFLKTSCINITIDPVSDSANWKVNRDKSKEAIAVLNFFAMRSSTLKDIDINNDSWANFGQSGNAEVIREIKENAIDLETARSAKFVAYPLENIIPQQFSITMGNILANTKLKAEEGYAPQYAGGQDTAIDFMFYTKDRGSINALNLMQTQAAEQLVKYRNIIKCWPVRMDSEMTRLCGINEVILESVDISTVPMQPGLFAVSVRAISVDRTMRNRESLNRLDEINNSGSINSAGKAKYVYNTYFQLNNVLSKTEIYPDLELPTIEELEKDGFKFIRYMKNKYNRTYPDPDFYFVYSYPYSAQILRRSVMEYFKNASKDEDQSKGKCPAFEIKTNFADNTNSQLVTRKYDPGDENNNPVLMSTYKNKQEKDLHSESLNVISRAKEYVKNNADTKDSAVAISVEDREKEQHDKNSKTILQIESSILSFDAPTWNVNESIKCTFTEANYKKFKDIKVDEINKKIIGIIDNCLKKPITNDGWDEVRGVDDFENALQDSIEDALESETGAFGAIKEIVVGTLGLQQGSDFNEVVKAIFVAGARANSANKEYDPKISHDLYKAKTYLYSGLTTGMNNDYRQVNMDMQNKDQYIPYSVIVDKDTQKKYYARTVEEAVQKGITFGPYQTTVFNRNDLIKFYNKTGVIIKNDGFLDSYYNKDINKDLKDNELNEYKKMMIKVPRYSLEAFARNTLQWIKTLTTKELYISLFDAKRKACYQKAIEALDKITAEGMNGNNGAKQPKTAFEAQAMKDGLVSNGTFGSEEALKIKQYINTYDYALATGKIFTGVCLAVTNGNAGIYENIKSRNMGSLAIKISECQRYVNADVLDQKRKFRKLVRGLYNQTGGPFKKTLADLGTVHHTALDDAIAENNEKLWLSASQDPSKWVLHSMYDMVVNNKRGRMARAFPTYYMMLIDEGREIGYWKVHDNFYNMSSIADIEVVKSRKIPADTAKITMTNMFGTYTSDDSDIKTDYQHNIRDVFNSIFSPRTFFEELEMKRNEQLPVNKIKMRPGARMHLRMGYSGDASELPVMFNGVVAEVGQGEIMTLMAQGDGVEISNPDAFSGTTAEDAADLANESSVFKLVTNFLTEGNTPKGLIKNIFTTKSGVKGKLINWISNGRFFNDNMFGITHFGEIDYKEIHRDGEIMQNIYEGSGKLPWDEDYQEAKKDEEYLKELKTSNYYSLDEPPAFTVELKGKSVNDVINICAATSIGYISGIAPFGIRSTIFHGRPNYYYAYDYVISKDGRIREKRKPYQQYHCINSFNDIISNNVMATGKDLKTVAVPIYKGPGKLNTIIEKKVPFPLYVDWDIYPEFQKTVTVNTGITYKGIPFGIGINDFIDSFSKDGGQKIAWRMGAKALHDSIKDMYQGEITIIGDPSIKPLDKVFLNDVYENMSGTFGVEAVVHKMDAEHGFSTSIFADCLSSIDDRYSQLGDMWTSQCFGAAMAAETVTYFTNKNFTKNVKPAMSMIANYFNKGSKLGDAGIDNIFNIAKEKDIIKYSTLENWNTKFLTKFGISKEEINLMNEFDKFKDIERLLDGLKSKNPITLMNSLRKSKALLEFNSEGFEDALKKALDNNKITEEEREKVEKVLQELKDSKITGNDINFTNDLKDINNALFEHIDELEDLTDDNKKELKNIKKILKSNNVKDINNASSMISDLLKDENIAQKVDYEKIAKLSDKAKDIGKSADKLKDGIDGVIKISKKINLGKDLIFAPSIAVSSAAMIAETIFFYVLSKSIYNYIENVMANLNVLTIHPLKKNGVAYVAGIDGNKGSVLGSRTWNMQGPMENLIGWVFKKRGFLYNTFIELMASDEMKNISKKYTKDYTAMSGNAKQQEAVSGMLEHLAEDTARKMSAFKALSLAPRISNLKDMNAKQTFNRTRIQSFDDPRISEDLIPIANNNVAFREYFNNGTLKLANDLVGEKDKIVKSVVSKACGNTYFAAIKIGDVYDIPFLRDDAAIVLKRTLEKLNERLKNKKSDGKNSECIILKSATTIGNNKWNSTGYVFRIQAVGFDYLKDIISEMHKESKEFYINDKGYSLFMDKQNGDSVDIFTSPKDQYILGANKGE